MASAHEKMALLLHEAASELCKYLEKVLPSVLGEKWWQTGVLNALSDMQSLSELDFAASLRVLDFNWHCLSGPDGLAFESRNYLKEMITVRNRWAHATVAGFNVEAIYRDMDTLQLFLEAFGASPKLIEEVRKTKFALMTKAIRPATPQPTAAAPTPTPALPQSPVSEPTAPATPATEFTIGQLVHLRSDPSARGPVTAVHPTAPKIAILSSWTANLAPYMARNCKGKKRSRPPSSA